MTMTQEIKLTTDQMKLMSLFQNITKATARDCIEDEKRDRIIFVVNEGKMGLAIGKGGAHIKSLQNNEISFGKNIEQSTILNRLPPLIKGYLRAGGMVSENFYIDKEFETIDYCVVMLTEKIVSRYHNKFLN